MSLQKDKKRLMALLEALDRDQRRNLIEFAEFLSSKTQFGSTEIQEPSVIDRPEKESVVNAIRRLSESYPMLDKPKLLNEASVLMSQHMLQGRDAVEVIDELEVVFAEQYKLYLADKQG